MKFLNILTALLDLALAIGQFVVFVINNWPGGLS